MLRNKKVIIASVVSIALFASIYAFAIGNPDDGSNDPQPKQEEKETNEEQEEQEEVLE